MTTIDRRAVLRRLALDAVTVEVLRELRRHAIEPVLLKGRSIADRLYPEPATRTYNDVDLLVAPECHRRAGRVLAGLGFADHMDGAREHERCGHGYTWVRAAPGPAVVDLHFTLHGARGDASVVWAALCRHTRPLSIGAGTVAALDDVGLALHVVLHAVQHGVRREKSMADLGRALATFDAATFEAAARLAARVGATPDFVAGLRLVPEGRAFAAAFGHRVELPATTAVKALTAVRGTGSIALVLAEPRWRRPLAVVHRVFPSPRALRGSMPLARRGRWGVAAAYAIRPFWMAAGLPAAVRDWRAAAAAWRG